MATTQRAERPPLLLIAVMALLLALLAALTYRAMTRPSAVDDQCAKPVPERTGGWFCYVPAGGGGSPSPGLP
jgi:hypothetical protein